MGKDKMYITNTSTSLSAANGTKVKVLGKTHLKFKMNNKIFSFNFLIAKLNNLHAILGNYFLHHFNVAMKFGKGVMQIGKHKIKLT
jgi:hypothetical protein